MALVAGAYVAGRWQTKPAAPAASSSKVLYYRCPMHPQYKADRPGDAPCCGMRLEPVYAEGSGPAKLSMPPGAVEISAVKQQLIGVRFGTAEVLPGVQSIRAAGRVAYDQSQTIVIADVYEYEAPLVRLGGRALVRRSYYPQRSFWATVEYFYPRIDAQTRTLKVRLSAGDVGVKLLPESYVDVEFRIEGPPALIVPAGAVMQSGQYNLVYVAAGEGYLAPRRVETGRRLSAGIEILKGLKAGERIVISGTFLVDSESRLKTDFHNTARRAGRDPVCGMDVEPTTAGNRKSAFGGSVYYFCSDGCKKQFDRNPKRFTSDDENWEPPSPPAIAHAAPGLGVDLPSGNSRRGEWGIASFVPLQAGYETHSDPICGKEVKPGESAFTARFQGTTYYFCSRVCKARFDENPAGSLAELAAKQDREYPAAHPAMALQVPPDRPAPAGHIHNDPVCGKPVDEASARIRIGAGRTLSSEFRGVRVYFCSRECKREFDMNPELYGIRALGQEKPAEMPEAGKPAPAPVEQERLRD